MTAVELRRWTVAEYHRLIETEILTASDRVELINGEIIRMSPQGPPHASTTQQSDEALKQTLGAQVTVRVQLPITLATSEPEPDLAIVKRRADAYSTAHPYPDDILLIVEVSDSTLEFDRTTKAQTYGKAGILEYWVIDVAGRNLYVLRQPNGNGYGTEMVLGGGDRVSPIAFLEVAIEVDSLLAPISVT
jgi:Uma2 family endonuclease